MVRQRWGTAQERVPLVRRSRYRKELDDTCYGGPLSLSHEWMADGVIGW